MGIKKEKTALKTGFRREDNIKVNLKETGFEDLE